MFDGIGTTRTGPGDGPKPAPVTAFLAAFLVLRGPVRKREGDTTMGAKPARTAFEMRIFRMLYRPLVRRAAGQILQGRQLDPQAPEKGRWLRKEVDDLLSATWDRVDGLVALADLAALPTRGNRHNVYLAIITTAAYQALLEQGQDKYRAAALVADVGWKIYGLGIRVVSLPFRLTTRDPGKRIERTINALLVFPFSAPGRPGYEMQLSKRNGDLLTHWTWCPPQAFVRALIQKQGDKGELDAFYRSWCQYDWPGADIIAADGKRGHYQRTRTLSRGNAVCDMCWRRSGNVADD